MFCLYFVVMKEDFLHYLWKFQKFSSLELLTTNKEELQVLKVGTHNTDSHGPDFLTAQLVIDNQKWAGNVEVHVKSSDWYRHNHQIDSNYDSVILHVVWEDDVDIYRSSNIIIPTLELQSCVSAEALHGYKYLYENNKERWINCENQLNKVSSFVWDNWLERLYFERLEEKCKPILELLLINKNNWEETCFCLLAKAFGSNINGEAFFTMAKSIPFSIIQKEKSAFKLEALFMGQCNMLNSESDDVYEKELYAEYTYLKNKFKLMTLNGITVQFFRLRPPNFPTIRLAQLATLYAKANNLFMLLNNSKNISELNSLLTSQVSGYWSSHYNFGKLSAEKKKKTTSSFQQMLLLNSVLPLRFLFQNLTKETTDCSSELILLLEELDPESNSIVTRYKAAGVRVKSSLHSQALLTLNKSYCNLGKCLSCSIGNTLIVNYSS